MRTGRRVCDTALYLPCDDIMLGGEIANRAAESFRKLGDYIEGQLVDFDIIDDEAILTAAERDGCLEVGGARLPSHHCYTRLPSICRRGGACGRVALSGRRQSRRSNARIRSIRAAVRDTDDERICFIFNRGTRRRDGGNLHKGRARLLS